MSYTDKKNELKYEPLSEKEAADCKKEIESIVANIETVIAGKKRVVELTTLSLIAEGHVLIEDVPGVGKTSLVSALAKSINCDYKRIQFTPDVMPSDITGFSIYNQKTGEFEFRDGSAMSNIVLADEINRASAKTQSALLELMEERQATVDSHVFEMDTPYMVLATQNPIESLGTYQLPEAQVDRFMAKLSMGYPDFDSEVKIIMGIEEAKKKITYVVTKEKVKNLISSSKRVVVSKLVASYITRIVEATRNNSDIKLGSSPRGGIYLYKLCRAYALYQGRTYVIPEDVKYLAPFVLSHRIILTNAAKSAKKTAESIINSIVANTVVPTSPEE